jgi:hypothetical protein
MDPETKRRAFISFGMAAVAIVIAILLITVI